MTMYTKADSIVEAFKWNGSLSQLNTHEIEFILADRQAECLIRDRYSKDVWVEIKAGDYLLRSHETWGKADPKWFEHVYRKVNLAD